jgi:hypothetical protein
VIAGHILAAFRRHGADAILLETVTTIRRKAAGGVLDDEDARSAIAARA